MFFLKSVKIILFSYFYFKILMFEKLNILENINLYFEFNILLKIIIYDIYYIKIKIKKNYSFIKIEILKIYYKNLFFTNFLNIIFYIFI